MLGCGGFRRAYAGAARFLVTMEGVEATPSLRTAPPCHQPPRMRCLVFLGQWGPGVLVAGWDGTVSRVKYSDELGVAGCA